MTVTKQWTILLTIGLVSTLWGRLGSAQELLVNPDLESPAVMVGWTLEEFVSGMPGVPVNAAQLQDFANQPMTIAGETGLWLRAFQGDLGDFDNEAINAVLSQTVPASAGETYTFSGWSRWESNYSGAVDFLDFLSPSGAIASPTESTFELAFLDASSNVIGTPTTLDLRTVQFGDNTWREHAVMDTAPAGTEQVRVTAAATDMLFNIDPGQSGFYDNFSLTAESSPGAELLENGDLNTPERTPGWELVELPEGANTAAFTAAGFANNTPDGGIGVWLRAFATANPEGEAIVTQTVDGIAGAEYTFSAWSKWEENYSGGQQGTPTETLLELAFLDESEEVIGMPETLDLRTEQMNDDTWREHSLAAVAPAGTASVRVSGVARQMFSTEGAQSAFFDDFSLTVATAGLPGDYNEDGVVDAADYTLWRDNLGAEIALPNEGPTPGMVTAEDYEFWKSNFGTAVSGNLLASAAVPEPASWALLAIGGLGAWLRRRCRQEG